MTVDSRFNPMAVEMLRRVGGDRLVSRMAQMFRTNAPARLEGARTAVGFLQPEEFSRAMHSLKSSAGQMGAVRLQALCAELESTPLCEENRESILLRLDQAVKEMNAAVEWLDAGVPPGLEPK